MPRSMINVSSYLEFLQEEMVLMDVNEENRRGERVEGFGGGDGMKGLRIALIAGHAVTPGRRATCDRSKGEDKGSRGETRGSDA